MEEQGHQRWTHYSPLTEALCRDWFFVDAEVFIPKRRQLLQAGTSQFPFVYIQLAPMPRIENSQASYDQLLLACIRRSIENQIAIHLNRFLSVAAKELNAVMCLEQTRRVTSLNEFESIMREDSFYVGMAEKPQPEIAKMKGKWNMINVAE